jgi:hypothetical protein
MCIVEESSRAIINETVISLDTEARNFYAVSTSLLRRLISRAGLRLS